MQSPNGNFLFYAGVGTGAYFLQSLAEKFSELHSDSPNYGRGKECDCVILLFSHLYNFKVSVKTNYRIISNIGVPKK